MREARERGPRPFTELWADVNRMAQTCRAWPRTQKITTSPQQRFKRDWLFRTAAWTSDALREVCHVPGSVGGTHAASLAPQPEQGLDSPKLQCHLLTCTHDGCGYVKPYFRDIPPPIVLTRARFWFGGQKCRVAVFRQARVTVCRVPRNTCCRHKPTLPLHDYKRVSNRPAYTPRTQEHTELQLHRHFDVHVDPSCSLHKATNHILYWIGTAETIVPKKAQKCGRKPDGGGCIEWPTHRQPLSTTAGCHLEQH